MSLESQILHSIFGRKRKPIVVKKSRRLYGVKNIDKTSLRLDTLSHQQDVKSGLEFISSKLLIQGDHHDHTKIDNIDDFLYDLEREFKGDDLKGWWEVHLSERHHLNDSVPDDVNLIDVLEMLVDCCVAGMARDGEVYDIKIKPEVLMKAFKNTQKLLCDNIEVCGNSIEGDD